MKHIHIILEDEELDMLLPIKGKMTWHDLLMGVVEGREEYDD
jgi:hypothetical protein